MRALRTSQVWLVAATGAVGFAGFFAVDTYIAPVTTDVAGSRPRRCRGRWSRWVSA
ncbi:hypothetical protein NKG94_14695 [Micromonospora sp. M12]